MKIGIISAMPIELNYVLNHIDFEQKNIKQNNFFLANYGKHELVLVAGGVGKVNAATYTQILADHFKLDCLINIGIAGGLHNDLNHLDIVVGSSYCHHDVRVSQMERLFPKRASFLANSKLLEAIEAYNIPGMTGCIVSGESFISDLQHREQIITNFNAVAVDMETSAIAHTCFINRLPFIALRGISDLANEEADTAYELNEALASDHVGKMLLKILASKEFDDIVF